MKITLEGTATATTDLLAELHVGDAYRLVRLTLTVTETPNEWHFEADMKRAVYRGDPPPPEGVDVP